jgi:DNA-binding beta-propeller fold protein YncE
VAFTAEGNLLISDSTHNRVLLFKPPFQNGMAAANVIGQTDFGSSVAGNAANRLNRPQEISVDTDDRLYVADSANNRVQIFDRITLAPNGPNAAFSLGAQSGLRAPNSVFVNSSNGEIWVADSGRGRMLRLRASTFCWGAATSPTTASPPPRAAGRFGGCLRRAMSQTH